METQRIPVKMCVTKGVKTVCFFIFKDDNEAVPFVSESERRGVVSSLQRFPVSKYHT